MSEKTLEPCTKAAFATKGADQALEFIAAHSVEIDPAINRRIVRKIDLHVLLWLCFLYFLQYLDKGT
jgi:hypothetical protein